MIQYLTIPLVKSSAGVDGLTFNVNLITSVVAGANNTFTIYSPDESYTFTTTGTRSKEAVAAINAAILNGGKPVNAVADFASVNLTIPNLPTISV